MRGHSWWPIKIRPSRRNRSTQYDWQWRQGQNLSVFLYFFLPNTGPKVKKKRWNIWTLTSEIKKRDKKAAHRAPRSCIIKQSFVLFDVFEKRLKILSRLLPRQWFLDCGRKEGDASQRHCSLAGQTSTLGETKGDQHPLSRKNSYITKCKRRNLQREFNFLALPTRR